MGVHFPVAHAGEKPWQIGLSTSHEYFGGHFAGNNNLYYSKGLVSHDLRMHGSYLWDLNSLDMSVLGQFRHGWSHAQGSTAKVSLLALDYHLLELLSEDTSGVGIDAGIQFSYWADGKDHLPDFGNIKPELVVFKPVGPITFRLESSLSVPLGVAAKTEQYISQRYPGMPGMNDSLLGGESDWMPTLCALFKRQQGLDRFMCWAGNHSYLRVNNQLDLDAELLPNLILSYSVTVSNTLLAVNSLWYSSNTRWSHSFIGHLRVSYDMKSWLKQWLGTNLSIRTEVGAMSNHPMFKSDGSFIPPIIFNALHSETNGMRIYWTLAFEY